MLIFVLGSLASIVAVTTGNGAEDVVEKISGISKNYIETHEESAETFAVLSYFLGGFSLLGLWASFKEKSFSNILNIVILVFAFVVLFFAKETGTTGGEIRHTEIRSDYQAPKNENMNKEEDDD